MSFRVFEPAYVFLDERLSAFLGDRLGAVIAEVEGPLRIALVLYIVLYGFAIFRGAISEPVMDFAIRAIKLLFIYVLATTPAYSDFVTEPLFRDLPNLLTRAISGADSFLYNTTDFFMRSLPSTPGLAPASGHWRRA